MTTSAPPWGIYLQGGTELSHGLTSSPLSNIAVRSGEIADSVISRCTDRGPAARLQVLVTDTAR